MDIFALIFLSTFVEGFVEYVFNVATGSIDNENINPNLAKRLKPYTHYVALVLGVVVAIAYKVDIPSMFGLTTNFGIVNWIISGIAIGRGSNYLNDLISKVRQRPSPVAAGVTNIDSTIGDQKNITG